MIYGTYQLANKGTEILPLATSHKAVAQFNHAFAVLIFMPYFKNINFYQDRPKIKQFLQKNAQFSSAGGGAL